MSNDTTTNTPAGFDPHPRRLMTVAEIADALNCTDRFARRILTERRVPVVKLGHHVRVWSTDLDAWLADNTRGGAR